MATSQISFIGTGDVGPVHGPGDGFPISQYTELVRPVLHSVDLRFGNCERQYSTRGSNARGEDLQAHGRQAPEMARIFDDCGFQAVTIANNHMYDFGPEALLDTRALLLSKGIQVTGAGKDLDEARAPAIVDCKGVRVGFLGYSSVMPDGAEAAAGKVGVAKLGVKTRYEGRGPHSPVRVLTEPDETDLAMIIEDIRRLRPQVDVLMLAFHWGVVRIPRIIADYQVAVAHACIDAGADLIMGHHAHVPKAIEVYKGKAIFYSLGNFCMTNSSRSKDWKSPPWLHGAIGNYADLDRDYPLMPYGSHAPRSLVVKALLDKQGVRQVGFLPMWIDRKYRPEVLKASDPRFQSMVDYMDWASEGFEHRFERHGDEVIVA